MAAENVHRLQADSVPYANMDDLVQSQVKVLVDRWRSCSPPLRSNKTSSQSVRQLLMKTCWRFNRFRGAVNGLMKVDFSNLSFASLVINARLPRSYDESIRMNGQTEIRKQNYIFVLLFSFLDITLYWFFKVNRAVFLRTSGYRQNVRGNVSASLPGS